MAAVARGVVNLSGAYDVAVVGGGLTGLTAAFHAASAGAAVLHVIGAGLPGGLAANVGALDGYPAASHPVSALDIALQLGEQNDALGVEVIPDDASVITVVDGLMQIVVAGAVNTARSVVLASGARLKMLDVPGAETLIDKGVSQCAWCNGSLHRGQDVVVVGGGDAALQEGLHLAEYASSVTIITRGDRLRARRSYVDRAAGHAKIRVVLQSEVAEVLGDDAVTGVRLRSGAGTSELACRGVFVYIGLDANAEMIGELAQRDARGFVITDANLETSTPGVFAAGAVRSGYSGRLVDAVEEGKAAATAALRRRR